MSSTPSFSAQALIYHLAIPSGGEVLISSDFEEISRYPGVIFDLRYATQNNFVCANMYGEFRRPYLHRLAAAKFLAAVKLLQERKPGWRFVVFDALRPRSVQRVLWQMVAGSPQQEYVADPEKGSMHNYGMALDLSLQDGHGQELEMGTSFDAFRDLAEFKTDMKRLVDHLRSLRPRPDVAAVLVPGDPEAQAREERLRLGIPLDTETIEQLTELATNLNLEMPRTI